MVFYKQSLTSCKAKEEDIEGILGSRFGAKIWEVPIRPEARGPLGADNWGVDASEEEEANAAQEKERTVPDSTKRVPNAARLGIERQIAGGRNGALIVDEKEAKGKAAG